MNKQPKNSQCAEWLKALAQANRLEIMTLLLDGPKTVTTLAEFLGVEIASASHHLHVLLHAGLVETTKQGRFALYRINKKFLRRNGRKHGLVLDFKCCQFQIRTDA